MLQAPQPAAARGHVPERQEHAEREHRDHRADAHDQERLDRRAQILEIVVDLALVEVATSASISPSVPVSSPIAIICSASGVNRSAV